MMYYCIALNRAGVFATLLSFQIINQGTTIYVPPALSSFPENWMAVMEPSEKWQFWKQVILDLQDEKLRRVHTLFGEWCLLPIPAEYQEPIHFKQSNVMIDWHTSEAEHE